MFLRQMEPLDSKLFCVRLSSSLAGIHQERPRGEMEGTLEGNSRLLGSSLSLDTICYVLG